MYEYLKQESVFSKVIQLFNESKIITILYSIFLSMAIMPLAFPYIIKNFGHIQFLLVIDTIYILSVS